MRKNAGFGGGLLLAFFMFIGAQGATAQGEGAGAACREDVAVLNRADGRQAARFHIEIADDAEERAQGLMHREALPASAGMLFIYPEAAPRAFWMKNTLIPLDILFFDAAGGLLNTVANATPLREDPLPSIGDAQYVLEIQGGMAAKLSLGEGVALRHPRIEAGIALSPCP